MDGRFEIVFTEKAREHLEKLDIVVMFINLLIDVFFVIVFEVSKKIL